jgi:hypothetical protein
MELTSVDLAFPAVYQRLVWQQRSAIQVRWWGGGGRDDSYLPRRLLMDTGGQGDSRLWIFITPNPTQNLLQLTSVQQCSGTVTCGTNPDPRIRKLNGRSDSALFVSGSFQENNNKNNFCFVFLLTSYYRYIYRIQYSVISGKKSQKS